jgi:hypothetical protein
MIIIIFSDEFNYISMLIKKDFVINIDKFIIYRFF